MKKEEMMLKATQMLAKGKFKLKKAIPTIMIVGAAIGGVTAAVLACKATLKAEEIIAEHKMKVLKPIKDDPDNPFGAALTAAGQSEYIGADGKKHLSPINKLREEGEWDTMAKNLSSQFLSKQPIKLIKQQLNLTLADRKAEYEEIMNYDNPTIKKKLLIDFADTCEGNSMTLKASSFPGQSTKVILPLTKISEKECYCPTYENGTQLALIRYPHAGTFEIEMQRARDSIGASGSKTRITFTDREWEAVQKGAISDSKLTKILNASKSDEIVKRAMPKTATVITNAKMAKAKAMLANGYTYNEIAKACGVPESTVYSALNK